MSEIGKKSPVNQINTDKAQHKKTTQINDCERLILTPDLENIEFSHLFQTCSKKDTLTHIAKRESSLKYLPITNIGLLRDLNTSSKKEQH